MASHVDMLELTRPKVDYLKKVSEIFKLKKKMTKVDVSKQMKRKPRPLPQFAWAQRGLRAAPSWSC